MAHHGVHTNDLHFNESDDGMLVETAIEVENNLKRRKSCAENADVKRPKLNCDICGKTFKYNRNLKRHMNSHFTRIQCLTCGKSFTQKHNLVKHGNKCSRQHTINKQDKQLSKQLTCRHCDVSFDDVDSLFTHVANHHPLNQTGGRMPKTEEPVVSQIKRKRFRFKKSAINKSVNRVDLMPIGDEKYDLLRFLANTKTDVEEIIVSRQKKQKNVKWYVNARVEMVRDIDDGQQRKKQQKLHISSE